MSNHNALHRAYKVIVSLDPLDPEASPTSKAHFRTKAKLYRRYAGQMFAHIAGVCEASEISADEDEAFTILEAPSTVETTSTTRYTQIEALVADAKQLVTADVLNHLFVQRSSKKLTLQQAEDQAFVRLLIGYKITESPADIVAMIDPDQERRELSATVLTHRVDEMKDTTERLREREAILSSIDDQENADTFLFSILRCIHAIQFAKEWNAMTNLRGGKKWKAEYCKKAFDDMYLGGEGADYDKEFKRFRTRHEKLIAARNTLLKMYNKFGAAVFMDPIWAPVASYEHGRARSTTFAATLELVINVANVTWEYSRDNREGLLKLVMAVVSKECFALVKPFLDV